MDSTLAKYDIVAHVEHPKARGVVREIINKNGTEYAEIYWGYVDVEDQLRPMFMDDCQNIARSKTANLILVGRRPHPPAHYIALLLADLRSDPQWFGYE